MYQKITKNKHLIMAAMLLIFLGFINKTEAQPWKIPHVVADRNQKDASILWKNTFGGSAVDNYRSVTKTPDGIVAVGFSYGASFGNKDWEGIAGKGGNDAIIVKYNDNGNVMWKKNFGGSGDDQYNSITAVSDGVIAVGYSANFNNGDWDGITGKGGNDAIIVKYDHDGNIMWKKNFGGSGADQYTSVVAISDGYIAVGHSAQTSFGNGDWADVTGKGNRDAIIVKYDNNGNVVWKNNFGGANIDEFASVKETADGVVAVGYSAAFGNGDWADVPGKGSYDAIIVKFDQSGNVVWKKNFGGNSTDYFTSITVNVDNICVSGYSALGSFGNGDWIAHTGNGLEDATIVKYDHDGNVVWANNFGGSGNDRFQSIVMVADSTIAVGYSVAASFGNGDWTGVAGKGQDDATIVNFNNAGNVIWKKNFGGDQIDQFTAVAATANFYIAVGYSALVGSGGTGDWAGFPVKGGQDATIVKMEELSVVPVSSLSNLPTEAAVNVPLELTATVLPETATNQTIIWSVLNQGGTEASITENIFLASAEGIATVRATIPNGLAEGSDYTQDFNINVVFIRNTFGWKNNFGGSGDEHYQSVTAVSDGVVAVGYAAGSSFGNGNWIDVEGKGSDDAIIVKYNHNGNVIWLKNFGGSEVDIFNAVATVSDGIIAVGYSTAFGSGDWTDVSGKGDDDAIIVKYDNNGNVVWRKNFGGNARDRYRSVAVLSDGIVAVGMSLKNSFGNGDWIGYTGNGIYEYQYDAIMVKYDHNGNVVWKKNIGGNGMDEYFSVKAVENGFVAVGWTDQMSFDSGDWIGITGKGSDDAVIVKYDNNGNAVWKKNFGGSGADRYDAVIAVPNGIIAIGRSGPDSFGTYDWTDIAGKGGVDAIIVKYDHSGNVVWKKNFGGNGTDEFRFVTLIPGGIVAVGASEATSFGNGDWSGYAGSGWGDATIIKYDYNGNITWQTKFGGINTDVFNSVTTVPNGIVAVGSSNVNSFGTGDWVNITGKGGIYDATIVKYNMFEDFIPVTNITDVPTEVVQLTNLLLLGTVEPIDATYQFIEWSMVNSGTTNGSINANTFYATTPGTAIIRATIENGLAIGTDYTQDFNITVNVLTFSITASVTGGNGIITPSGNVSVLPGANQTFTITPNEGYHIDQVLVDGVNNPAAVASGSYTFTNVTTNHTIVASFAINTYTIAASVSGGNGTITPSGNVSINHGANQTFTITPNANYHITQVLVDGVNNPAAVASGSYTFTNVTANHTIIVSFAINTYIINASVTGGNGTIAPSGAVSVNHGANQIFAITPNVGYHINQVLVDGVNNPTAVASGSYTFTNVTANHTIVVSFAINTYTIAASVSGGNGTITPSGNVSVNHGTNQTFTITSNEGYHIDQVLVDGVNNPAAVASGSYTFSNVTANHTIVASFAINTYTIAASVTGGNGTITPNGNVSVNHGANQTFTITPNANYHIAQVLVDGVNNPAAVTSGSYTFTNVTANHTIVASFEENPPETYIITASVSGENGTISPSGEVSVIHSANQSFTITPNEDYCIAQVLVDGVNNPAAVASGSYTFTNVTANHTIVASFEPDNSIDDEGALVGFSIYPNPAYDELYLQRNRSTTISVAIYNSVGALVYTSEISNELHKIDLSNLCSGIYMIALKGNSTYTTKKFIKQ